MCAQPAYRLLHIVMLAVVFQVFQMCDGSIFTLSGNDLDYLYFIIGLCFPFLNRDGAFRALANTGAETVAHQVTDQACFSINDLKSAFRTTRNA